MSIIAVDCEDCYRRADKFAAMAKTCAGYADKLGAEGGDLAAGLRAEAEEFAALSADIRAATDVWTDFYTHNVRTD